MEKAEQTNVFYLKRLLSTVFSWHWIAYTLDWMMELIIIRGLFRSFDLVELVYQTIENFLKWLWSKVSGWFVVLINC